MSPSSPKKSPPALSLSKEQAPAPSAESPSTERKPPKTIFDADYDPQRARAAKAALSKVIDTEVRVTVTDGRVFVGMLKCTDRDRNLVVADTMEYRDGNERFVSLIMIPGKHIVKFEVSPKAYARISAATGAGDQVSGRDDDEDEDDESI